MTSPQNTAPNPKPTIRTVVRPLPAGVRKPSTNPATTSQNIVPRMISTAARDSDRSASPRARGGRAGGGGGGTAARRGGGGAGAPRHDNAAELEHAVREY